jgi:hypothetical protein
MSLVVTRRGNLLRSLKFVEQKDVIFRLSGKWNFEINIHFTKKILAFRFLYIQGLQTLGKLISDFENFKRHPTFSKVEERIKGKTSKRLKPWILYAGKP